jgi:hypothetical protein
MNRALVRRVAAVEQIVSVVKAQRDRLKTQIFGQALAEVFNGAELDALEDRATLSGEVHFPPEIQARLAEIRERISRSLGVSSSQVRGIGTRNTKTAKRGRTLNKR